MDFEPRLYGFNNKILNLTFTKSAIEYKQSYYVEAFDALAKKWKMLGHVPLKIY